MAKLIVIYEKPHDEERFNTYYQSEHIPLVQKMQGLKGASIHKVVQSMNTDLHLYLIAELEFNSVDSILQSLGSPEGQAVQNDVQNLMKYLNKPPIISITE